MSDPFTSLQTVSVDVHKKKKKKKTTKLKRNEQNVIFCFCLCLFFLVVCSSKHNIISTPYLLRPVRQCRCEWRRKYKGTAYVLTTGVCITGHGVDTVVTPGYSVRNLSRLFIIYVRDRNTRPPFETINTRFWSL